MARVFLFDSDEVHVIYSVEEPVGLWCKNRQDDVLLVQFFLKVLSEIPEREEYRPPGKGILVTDGIWGPLSQAYLDQFLAATNSLNPTLTPVKVDGRVDPFTGRSVYLTGLQTEFTLSRLQRLFMVYFGIPAFNDITKHPKFPPLLNDSIKKFN